MRVFTFTSEQLRQCVTLFPPDLDEDPWVFYHATSSVSEPDIDAEGLVWRPGVCSYAEIVDVVQVFKSINWHGLSGGAYAALDGFTLQGDFRASASKPIYFREHSTVSLIYARRDFAGGESARAVRRALHDLETYLKDEKVRDTHYDYQRRECVGMLRSGSPPTRVVRVDLEWLRARLETFQSLRQRCDEIKRSHTHGVVYAVKFAEGDIPSLNYSSSMGLGCFAPLGVERMVGRAIVPPDDVECASGKDFEMFLRHRCLERAEMRLLAAIAAAEREGRAYRANEVTGLLQHQRDDFLDKAAGEDESFSLTLKYVLGAASD